MCRLKFAVPIVSDMSNLRYRRQHYATPYLSLYYIHRFHLPRAITPLALSQLASPSKKGRWIAGKAQTVALLRFACDTPAFFNLPNLSTVKTEGLHSVSTIILIGGIWSGTLPPDVL